jgi:hypothetical protein
MRDCFVSAFGGIKNGILYSKEVEAYLSARFLIADRVRPVIGCQFAQLDHKILELGTAGHIPFRARTEHHKSYCTDAYVTRSAKWIHVPA